MYVHPTLPAMGRVGFFMSHQSHPISSANPTMPALQIPCQSHPKNMLYISSIFLVSPPLSVGHPAPPSTPLVRPRTAVCSRGARARRERSGSGAPADGYMRGHRAAAAPCRSSARHVQPCRSRSRITLPFIRAACTALSFARAQHPAVHQRDTPHVQRQKQPPAATHPPMLTPHRLPCHSTWNMAGCSPHSTPCAHARSAVPCVT